MAIGTNNEVDQIRSQMAQIRQKLHQDMQGVVAGAEAASDWKYYVRLYPWAAVAACLAVGFVVVPRKRRSVSQTAEKAAEKAVAKVTGAVEVNGASLLMSKPTAEKKKGWIAGAFALAAPLALRAAQTYALSYMEQWMAQQQAAATGPPGPPPGSSVRGGPGPLGR